MLCVGKARYGVLITIEISAFNKRWQVLALLGPYQHDLSYKPQIHPYSTRNSDIYVSVFSEFAEHEFNCHNTYSVNSEYTITPFSETYARVLTCNFNIMKQFHSVKRYRISDHEAKLSINRRPCI